MVIAAFNKISGFKNSRVRYSGGIKNPGQVIHRGEKDGHEGYYSLETMPPHHRWFGQSLVGALTLARLNFILTLYDVIHKNYILIIQASFFADLNVLHELAYEFPQNVTLKYQKKKAKSLKQSQFSINRCANLAKG